MTSTSMPEPNSSDWTDGYERLLFEVCPACGKRSYFRRGFCPSCGAQSVEIVASQCQGKVYAATTVVRAPSPEWKALAPYTLVLIDLDEGPRVMVHGSAGLCIGDRVHIGWQHVGERLIPRAELFSQDKEIP
jgi:uncharacterized OB-fold protein